MGMMGWLKRRCNGSWKWVNSSRDAAAHGEGLAQARDEMAHGDGLAQGEMWWLIKIVLLKGRWGSLWECVSLKGPGHQIRIG